MRIPAWLHSGRWACNPKDRKTRFRVQALLERTREGRKTERKREKGKGEKGKGKRCKRSAGFDRPVSRHKFDRANLVCLGGVFELGLFYCLNKKTRKLAKWNKENICASRR